MGIATGGIVGGPPGGAVGGDVVPAVVDAGAAGDFLVDADTHLAEWERCKGDVEVRRYGEDGVDSGSGGSGGSALVAYSISIKILNSSIGVGMMVRFEGMVEGWQVVHAGVSFYVVGSQR